MMVRRICILLVVLCVSIPNFAFNVKPLSAKNENDSFSNISRSNLLKHPINFFQPEQIHIAFGENVSSIVVTWSTFSATSKSIVEFGEDRMDNVIEGSSSIFVDSGKLKRSQYIHRVTLQNLKPNTQYMYHCGSKDGWSPIFFFRTVDPDADWSPRLLVYGDMGNINARSLPYLQEEIQKKSVDAILHVGDFAYDMRDRDGQVGDAFMNQLTPVAAYVPYMVCPGNHEEAYNFSHFKNRFSMPGQFDSMMYSFDMGPVHFVSINTEVYYFLMYGKDQMATQYHWLEQDLAKANEPENRAKRPWIITYGHRPMYCSDGGDPSCIMVSSRVRSGIPKLGGYGLEKLFYDYGVDVEIWAHEHTYERMFPVYNLEGRNGSAKFPYKNPKGPVHVITGSAGCQENTDPFAKKPKPWSAFRSSDYGYTRIQIYNSSHLYWEQVSVSKDGEVIDKIWIIKDSHGPYDSE